ncbi:MAG: hypothetical protein WCT52_04955 [Candidatus Micrarchaeia archaeon]
MARYTDEQHKLDEEIRRFNEFCYLLERKKEMEGELKRIAARMEKRDSSLLPSFLLHISVGGNVGADETQKEMLASRLADTRVKLAQYEKYGLFPSRGQMSFQRFELELRQKELFGTGGTPIYRGDTYESARLTSAELAAVSDYAALLRAKEKLRNRFGAKSGRKTISQEGEIRENFRSVIESRIAGAGGFPSQVEDLKGIFIVLSEKMSEPKSIFDSAVRALRKPKAALIRGATGLGLMAAGFVTGGIGFIAAGAVLGAAGRFAAVDGFWDTAHRVFSGRKSAGATAIAANVFYNNKKKFSSFQSARGIMSFLEENPIGHAQEIDKALFSFAGKMAWGNLAKRAVSFACALLPFAGSALQSLFEGKPEVSAFTEAKPSISKSPVAPPMKDTVQAVSDAKQSDTVQAVQQAIKPPVSNPIPPSAPQATNPVLQAAGEAYSADSGEGIWHLSAKAAAKSFANYSSLSSHEKTTLVNTIKNYVVENRAKVGLLDSELVGNGADNCPCLKKGADIIFTQENFAEALTKLPKWFADKHGLGKSLPISLKPQIGDSTLKLARKLSL